MRRGTCKGCGAPIAWVRTQAGRAMPCETKMVRYWETPGGRGKVLTPSGRVVSCTYEGSGPPSGMGYTPHFVACPEARKFRRRDAPAAECMEQLKLEI